MTVLAVNPLPRTITEARLYVGAATVAAPRTFDPRRATAVVCRTTVVRANRAKLLAELEHELQVALGRFAVAGRG